MNHEEHEAQKSGINNIRLCRDVSGRDLGLDSSSICPNGNMSQDSYSEIRAIALVPQNPMPIFSSRLEFVHLLLNRHVFDSEIRE